MDMLTRANKTKVYPKLMEDHIKAVEELPEGHRDYEGTTIEIVKRVEDLNLPDRQQGDLAVAISFRFQAFAHLMRNGGGRGWTAPGKDGCTFVHEELVRAAAEEPVIEVDRELVFDPESFHRRLLALAEPHGEA